MLHSGSALMTAVMHATAASIARHLEGSVAIKLRSQCVRVADELTSALPKARNIFLLRRAVPWIRSNHLAFRWTPATLANKLHYSLAAYDRLSGGLNDAERDQVDTVCAQDAQAGTLYAQDRIEKRELPDGFLTQYVNDDRHKAARALAERHGFAERLYEGLAG